ncbi:hypothetical protein C8239_14750 [Paracidovorax avenae]|nr:hypothetical protein C8239_14750 [Paracidovorax avenae]
MPQVVTSDGAFFTSLAKHLFACSARQLDEQLAKILIVVFERVRGTVRNPKIVQSHQNARGTARHRLANKVFMLTMQEGEL